jgi:hypothetical protein
MEMKFNETLERMERQHNEAIREINSKLEKCDPVEKLAEKLDRKIREYQTNPTGNFMSLLVETLRLTSDLAGDSPKITDLKAQLPVTIKNMTASNFCILSEGRRHFFAFENSIFASSAAHQRLGIRHDGIKPSTGIEWTIEADEDGDLVYLKNVHLGQYLYATEDKFPGYSSYRQMALAPKRQTGVFKWKFLPYNGSFDHFLVQNIAFEENFETSCGHGTSQVSTICTTKSANFWFSVEKC